MCSSTRTFPGAQAFQTGWKPWSHVSRLRNNHMYLQALRVSPFWRGTKGAEQRESSAGEIGLITTSTASGKSSASCVSGFPGKQADFKVCTTWTVILGATAEVAQRAGTIVCSSHSKNETLQLSTAPGGLREMGIFPPLTIAMPVFWWCPTPPSTARTMRMYSDLASRSSKEVVVISPAARLKKKQLKPRSGQPQMGPFFGSKPSFFGSGSS